MKKNIKKIYDLLNSGDFKLGFILGNSLGFSNIEIMNKLWDRYNESYRGLDWREDSIRLGKYIVYVLLTDNLRTGKCCWWEEDTIDDSKFQEKSFDDNYNNKDSENKAKQEIFKSFIDEVLNE